MIKALILIALSASLITGCVSKPAKPDNPEYAPVRPQALAQPQAVTGSIFNPATSMNLYSDGRAHRVGDILTIVLSEQTQSSKSAKTEVDKSSELSIPAPTILGKSAELFGNPLSFSQPESSSTFDGEGKSDMSNSLNGNITVTVHDVLPNGTLVVRGEKWLTLNQGDEFIRISGLVRPLDISTDNSVQSTKLADARITYSGTGTVADSNSAGWLSKFFISPLWPL